MLTITPEGIPPPKLHDILLSAVAPRPIAFVSTIDKEGNINLSPFSFFNCFGSNPPILIYSPARSGRTGATKNTYDNVLEVKECVVNIAHYDMLYQMNLAAGMYPKETNEFEKSGLTPVASFKVKPPRVAECHVQFECEVKQVIETGPNGGAGNLVICEVKMIHLNEKVLDTEGNIDPFKMKYIARLGKQFWCKVNDENIIMVEGFKPANDLGIGFDNLPDGIRKSKYLSGNDIARVASLHTFPTEEEIAASNQTDLVQKIFSEYKNDLPALEKAIHLSAKTEIEKGRVPLAFQLLMSLEKLITKIQ